MSTYLDKSGLSYLWSKLKALLANKADKVHTHAQSDITGLSTSLGGKQDKIVMVSVTLPVASWAGSAAPYTQTVTVNGILADETAQAIWPSPALSSATAWGEAQIMATGQAANAMTFSAKKKPTGAITVHVCYANIG